MPRKMKVPSEEDNISQCCKRFLWAIILLGVVLRAVEYLYNRSLFLDEASLSLNIVNRSFAELLQPLDYDQGAPIGFLVIQRVLVLSLGNNEYTLRLFPFICGIASVFLFYRVAKAFLRPEAVAVALGLFAISNRLIYYSSVVKQYSLDVAVALFLYAAAIHIQSRKLSTSAIALLAITGAIAVWLSHPAAFILAGVGTTMALLCLFRKDPSRLGRLLIVFSIWTASFACLYFVSLRQLARNEALIDYWNEHFMPFPPSSLSDIKWFGIAFIGFVKYALGFALGDLIGIPVFENGSLLPGLDALSRPHFIAAISLAVIALISALVATLSIIAGFFSMLTRRREKAALLLVPALFALLASGFRKYPFGSRFLLFMVPSALLVIAEGIIFMREKIRYRSAVVTVLLVGLLFSYPLLLASHYVVKPRTVEEIRPVLTYMKEHWQEGDTLYLYYGSLRAFSYYSERYSLNDIDFIAGSRSRHNLDRYISELNDLRGHKRVWILFSHVCTWLGVDEEQFFVDHLDEIGVVERRMTVLEE